MPEFLLLMHSDATEEEDAAAWPPYLAVLAERGMLLGGSEIGGGVSRRRNDRPAPPTLALVGYLKVVAEDMSEVERLCLPGNPTWLAGGTVEIRELPLSDPA